MARPPFSVNVLQSCRIHQLGPNIIQFVNYADGMHSSESTGGASSPKIDGWRTPTGYSLTYRSYRRAWGTCKSIQNAFPNSGQTTVYTGCVGGARFNSLDHFDQTVTEANTADLSLANLALIDARLKMKRSDVNLGVAFAERNATARLLGDTSTRIAKSFNNLKRGRVRAAMRDLGIANSVREPRGSNVPRKWLELQYGWKPLVSDVYGACEALSRSPRGNWRVTAKAQRFSSARWSKDFPDHQMSTCVAMAERGAFVRIDALPSNDLTMSLASLGVTNPLLIAWELVPYSFVVDWALPVGTWLESLDAMLGFSNIQISSTSFRRVNWVDTGRSGPQSNPAFRTENNFVGTKKTSRDASCRLR